MLLFLGNLSQLFGLLSEVGVLLCQLVYVLLELRALFARGFQRVRKLGVLVLQRLYPDLRLVKSRLCVCVVGSAAVRLAEGFGKLRVLSLQLGEALFQRIELLVFFHKGNIFRRKALVFIQRRSRLFRRGSERGHFL